MIGEKIRPHHLERKAILYVRQSSAHQVLHNRESSSLQYAMRDRLTTLGWSEIETIDEDLGRSASGSVTRAGFDRMVAEVCLGKVGAVAAREVSRFARNSRDWQQLDVKCSRRLVAFPMPALSETCSIDRFVVSRRSRVSASRCVVSHANRLSPVSSRKRPASVRSIMAAEHEPSETSADGSQSAASADGQAEPVSAQEWDVPSRGKTQPLTLAKVLQGIREDWKAGRIERPGHREVEALVKDALPKASRDAIRRAWNGLLHDEGIATSKPGKRSG